jgi:hypothetical protein
MLPVGPMQRRGWLLLGGKADFDVKAIYFRLWPKADIRNLFTLVALSGHPSRLNRCRLRAANPT